jgi:hypothetical protein
LSEINIGDCPISKKIKIRDRECLDPFALQHGGHTIIGQATPVQIYARAVPAFPAMF